ncbi:MAG: ArdC family protein [Actinomycetota bacterium]|nr:ArdC family protein [Actinomycetota bacterium]
MNTKADLLEKYGLDLEGAVRQLIRQGNWTSLLDLSARFRSYSAMNLLLLFSQACHRGFSPTLVAGYRGWQRLGRQVKKGEKALYIFAPNKRKVFAGPSVSADDEIEETVVGYRLVGVFDLSQTFGDDLPVLPEPRLLDIESSNAAVLLESLEAFLVERGFRVGYEELDAVNGFTDFENHLVKVRSDVSSGQRLKTLLHESAHVIFHQEYSVSRARAELEAESCAYVVCRALGFDSSSYSFPYVARWSLGDTNLVSQVAQTVHSGAGRLLDHIERWVDAAGRGSVGNLEEIENRDPAPV